MQKQRTAHHKRSMVRNFSTKGVGKPSQRLAWGARALWWWGGAVLLLITILGVAWLTVTHQGRTLTRGVSRTLSTAYVHSHHATKLSPVEVHFQGLRRTSERAVRRVLPPTLFAEGATLARVNPQAVVNALKAFPWIKHVRVVRTWPHTLTITVEERDPLALWHHKGGIQLIDFDGASIPIPTLRAFRHLPLVVGAGAPANARGILQALAATKLLKSLVTSAIFVHQRRWNLRLSNGCIVLLPAQNWDVALQSLDTMASAESLMAVNVESIDMRTPPHIIVRLRSDTAAYVKKEATDTLPGEEPAPAL